MRLAALKPDPARTFSKYIASSAASTRYTEDAESLPSGRKLSALMKMPYCACSAAMIVVSASFGGSRIGRHRPFQHLRRTALIIAQCCARVDTLCGTYIVADRNAEPIDIRAFIENKTPWKAIADMFSPIRGEKGNVEFLIYLR